MSMLLQAHKERVGRQIRKARKHAGLSHDALGAKVGTSRQHLIKLEKGMHLPSDAMLVRIAEATGKTPGFFESDEDDEESQLSFGAAMQSMFDRSLEAVVNQAVQKRLNELSREQVTS
jgi:transcriptional regulator with XRE-family HTH domain